MIDNKMSKFNRVLNSVVFRRVLVIFVVGLFCRGVVGFVFDIDVFKDFINSISLMYYGFMLCFWGVFCELPSISLEVFSISSIRKAISTILVSRVDNGKIILGVEVSSGQGVKNNIRGGGIDVNRKGVNSTGVMFAEGVNTVVESAEVSVSPNIGSGSSKMIGSGSSNGVLTSTGVLNDNMLTRAPLISGLSTPENMSPLVGGFSRSGSEVSSVGRLTRAPIISGLSTPENMSPLVGGFSGSDISSVDRLMRAPLIGSLSTPENMSPLIGGFSSSGIGSNQQVGGSYIASRVPSYQSMTNTHYSSPRLSTNPSIKSSLREVVLDETMVRDVCDTRKVEVNSWNTAEFEARRKSEFGKRKNLIIAAIESSNVEENRLKGGVGDTKERHSKSSVLGKVMTKFNEYIDSPNQDEKSKSVSISSRSVSSTSRSVRYSKSAGVRGLYGIGKR